MERIYSKIDPRKLLHLVARASDFQSGRQDLIADDQFNQCSMLKMNEGTTFRPHRHIWKERSQKVIAQESWLIVRGRVRAVFYDLDNTVLQEVVLAEGDASFTLEGGHNYLILEDGTLVYEYKTGPYEGQAADKEFIVS